MCTLSRGVFHANAAALTQPLATPPLLRAIHHPAQFDSVWQRSVQRGIYSRGREK